MSTTRTRNAGKTSNKEQLSREMRQSRLDLFLLQFEKEGLAVTAGQMAGFTSPSRPHHGPKHGDLSSPPPPLTAQERMNELLSKKENLLATVDKHFKVELMKIPPSLQKTRIGDLISEVEISASEVSIAMKNESLEMQQPLRRALSRRVKSTDSSPGQSTPVQRSSSKASKGGKGTKRTRTLVSSNSTGSLKDSSSAAKRTRSCLTKNNDPPANAKVKLRSVVSAGDLHCSMAGSAAHITVTTAQGQSLCFSDETKADINLDVLDDVAWCQIQKLSSLMDYLSKQGRCQR